MKQGLENPVRTLLFRGLQPTAKADEAIGSCGWRGCQYTRDASR